MRVSAQPAVLCHLAIGLASLIAGSGCEQIAWVAVMTPSAVAEAVTRSHRTVTFTVIDADTGAPIPYAKVYVGFDGWFKPDNVTFKTDANGRAEKWIVSNRGGGVAVEIDDIYTATINSEFPDPLPAAWTIRALRPPLPYYALEVPVGFRGRVVIDLLDGESRTALSNPGDPEWPPGKRMWVVRLSSNAPTTLPSIPEIYDDGAGRRLLRAQTSDGADLPLISGGSGPSGPDFGRVEFTRVSDTSQLSTDSVAFWEILIDARPHDGTGGGRLYFYVGTRNQAADDQRLLKAERTLLAPLTNAASREDPRVWYPILR